MDITTAPPAGGREGGSLRAWLGGGPERAARSGAVPGAWALAFTRGSHVTLATGVIGG